MARDRRPGFLHRFLIHTGRFFGDEAADAVTQAPDRARTGLRHLFHGKFTCACCPGKEFRGHRALNAHHLARHGGYWAGQKARATGRKVGKVQDAARRHARGWRHAAGLVDQMGNRTDRGRSRPRPEDRPVGTRDLRSMHRHDRDHERAEARDRRADRHEARGRDDRAGRHRARAAGLRDRWPQPARAVPVGTARPVSADANGHRPPPERTRPAPDGRTRT